MIDKILNNFNLFYKTFPRTIIIYSIFFFIYLKDSISFTFMIGNIFIELDQLFNNINKMILNNDLVTKINELYENYKIIIYTKDKIKKTNKKLYDFVNKNIKYHNLFHNTTKNNKYFLGDFKLLTY